MSPGMPSSTPAATKKASEKIVAEYIPKLAENVIHIHASTVKATPAIVDCCMAISIVLCPFVAVTQYFVSLSCLFKFFFGGFIPGVPVRMKLHGHFAVGFFNFIRRSRFCDT